MPPKVTQIERVELIRDGGSFAATFFESSGARWILFVQLKHAAGAGQLLPKQYLTPLLIDCDPSRRASDTSTVVHSEFSGPSEHISWDEARQLLKEIAKNHRDAPPLDQRWLQEMIDVVNRAGAPVT